VEFTPEAKRAFNVQAYGGGTVIEGVRVVDLVRHADDGGSMTELGRLADGRLAALGEFTVRQVNFSEVTAGAIKAFHLHTRQTDVWYVPPSDRMLVVLLDVRRGSRTEGLRQRVMLGNGASRLLAIPPGVAHGLRNIGRDTGRII
jgi:dTDP-4-dehydrorhamnose 3,5-epimerase